MPVTSSSDSYGTTFVISGEPAFTTRGGSRRRGCPEVEVWWSRNEKGDETLIVKQQYDNRATADVHEYTFGQVYDLIDVLNKAVEAK